MHSVNNGLSMNNNSDSSEIALEKIKNILVSFEKKKRNLEKRKNKLEEYKKKADLNEDQQVAVAKYPEVLSNLELLEELTTHAVQQLKEAEKSIKKIKKQEKIDKRRCESQLTEFVLRHYSVLERVGANDWLRRRLVCDGVVSDTEVNGLLTLCGEMRITEKGDLRICSEQLLSLFEAKTQRDELLATIARLVKIEWLWLNEVVECASGSMHEVEADKSNEEDEKDQRHEEIAEPTPIVVERLNESRPTPDCAKLSFVFLHDSVVQENGYNRFTESVEPRPSSQTSNHGWQTAADNAQPPSLPNVEDVFSSATQSQFMHSDNPKNAWAKGARPPLDARFSRGRASGPPTFTHEDSVPSANYWRGAAGGRVAFSSNPRYVRRGRGRGNGRVDYNRQMNDALTSQ